MPNVRTCNLGIMGSRSIQVAMKDTQNAFDFALFHYTSLPVFVWCPGTLLGENGYPLGVFSVDDLGYQLPSRYLG